MPPGRSRKFAPKAKTGCRTCRIRRIKCDERRPACQKCLSTGRKCDGYTPTGSNLARHAVSLGFGDLNSEDRRLFHLFRSRTSSQFSGGFESRFWSSIVLQACHVNSALRDAAIALALLHESFMQGPGRIQDSASLALRQYTKALEGTRKSLDSNGSSVIVTLISCVLSTCFDILQDQLASAVVHLRNGLNILRSSDVHIRGSSMASKVVINEDILGVFARLGFQVNYFIDRTHPVNQIQVVQQFKNLGIHQVARVSNLEEAQAALYACLNGTMFSDHAEDPVITPEFFRTRYHQTKCAQLILHGESSPEFAKGREKAISALEQWHLTFKDFLQFQEGVMNNGEIKMSTLLQLHHIVAKLMLTTACGFPKEKIDLKSAIDDFQKILKWSKVLAADAEPVPSLFSPDVGIIAPLFFVATKCPDAALRLEAKKILASGSRREGMWDAEVAVQIINEVDLKRG